MPTIYLTGQNNFGNRGCEALVRSAVATIRERMPDARFLVPSLDMPRDAAQWPAAAASGVRFVPSPVIPARYRQWGRLCRVLPALKSSSWPSLRGAPHVDEYLRQCDAVVSIGGDNYSLDYGLVSLFFFVGIAERALELGKTVALWGASVGPFSADRRVEKLMVEHLRRLHMVSIRESHSLRYLQALGLGNRLIEVADSAFVLARQPVNPKHFVPTETGEGILGINASPVVEKFARRQGAAPVADGITEFIDRVLSESGISVLLIPHVTALDGGSFNNDYLYLERIARRIPAGGGRVKLVPPGLNACQLKDVLAQCRFFIGARTHATIGALSSGVPTLSISYSVKARGINLDLFGHEKYVLPAPALSADTLETGFLALRNDEIDIRQHLARRIPEWKRKAEKSAEAFAEAMTRSRVAQKA
ncbi:MAG TPA: polysaccharide pyruvyl transferase family protein [Noviherbaspirillum sp.]